jgi:hypothetical protein
MGQQCRAGAGQRKKEVDESERENERYPLQCISYNLMHA